MSKELPERHVLSKVFKDWMHSYIPFIDFLDARFQMPGMNFELPLILLRMSTNKYLDRKPTA